MGHTEVTETPRESGHDRDPAAGDEVQREVRVASGDALQGIGRIFDASELAGERQRDDDDRDQHQQSLEEIGPADRLESSEEGVDDDDDRTYQHEGLVLSLGEDGQKRVSSRHECRCDIDGEEHEDDHSAQDPDDGPVLLETVGEVLGDGDRVVRLLGIHPQTFRDNKPSEIGTDRKTDSGPDLTYSC